MSDSYKVYASKDYVDNKITGMQAQAETLDAGSGATAAWDGEAGLLTLGNYGRQRIERRTNILTRELVTAGKLKRVPRSENNPHGLLITEWRTLLNKDIEQKTKSNY